MEFSLEQKRVISGKCNGHKLIKGNVGSGKTTAAINRIPVLLKSYCVEKDDNLLVVSLNDSHFEKLSSIYKNIEEDKYRQSSFFDEDNSYKLKIETIDKIVLYYFNQYKKNCNYHINIAKESICIDIVKKAINIVSNKLDSNKKHLKNKVLNIGNLECIRQELKWIKECNFNNISEYQNAYRNLQLIGKNNEFKLRKNSKGREAIFYVLEEYNNSLKQLNLIDYEDIALLALKEATKGSSKKFTHIIVDEAQELSKVKLEILKAIHNEKAYSSILFTVDNEKLLQCNGWINKKRNFKTLGYSMIGKCSNFKMNYVESIKIEVKKDDYIINDEIKNIDNLSVEYSQYIDLGRNLWHDFFVDSSRNDEVYVSDDEFNEKVDNLIEIPVFNEIAAGSPILMNESIKNNCYLPKAWIRSSKDVFILKIKGDSMVNRNINDGDYVVLNKQKYPKNHDIVAVEIEGEATLKTFKCKGREVVLMPENDAYDPIILDGKKDCSILGVAVGLIKGAYY